jgi:hypothetical protein
MTLQAALEFRDRAEEARRIVAAEGLTKGARSAHPMLRIELDARDSFTRLWRQLGLDEAESLAGPDLSIK